VTRPLRSLLVAIAAVCTALPASAARPIVDLHKLDRYFALFAHDSDVPWRPTYVRLDTYSTAPVAFAVYQAQPGDVLTAGTTARPRAIDTSRLRPIATWTFTPPGGYKFQSNEVPVPLGDREGFFVVEVRRAGVGEQVWIDRTRVGLVSKENASGIALYGTDLGTGRPLPHMRVMFVVDRRFVTRYTDDRGIVRWDAHPRPVFAIAQWGESFAFLSFLPQSPLPRAVVAVGTDSAAVHAGDELHVVGYVRRIADGRIVAGSGRVAIDVRRGPHAVAHAEVPLDAAGAFTTAFRIPASAPAGDYAVLAQADGAVGGAAVHVEADAGGVALSVAAACGGTCDAQADLPVVIRALRDGRPAADLPIRLTVVRAPHAYLGIAPPPSPWGTSVWFTTTVRTDANGKARAAIPHPTDGLDSTYGIRVVSGGATASARITVTQAPVILHLEVDRERTTLDEPVGFSVRAVSAADGRPVRGGSATVRLVHGVSVQEQTVALDRDGTARGSFSDPELGTSLVIAAMHLADGRVAMDAGQVTVTPQAEAPPVERESGFVRVHLDRDLYRPGEAVAVEARCAGASGDALISDESALGDDLHVVALANGQARLRMIARDAPGDLAVGAAFVHDGAIAWNATPLTVDGPGRPVPMRAQLRGVVRPGADLPVVLVGAPIPGTIAVRIARGTPSGSALFDDLPALLLVGSTTTQTSAPAFPTWHPWVDSTGKHPSVLGFVSRGGPPQEVTLAQAETRPVFWRVEHVAAPETIVPVPRRSGDYTLSVLAMGDDGRVAAASIPLVVP